MNPYRHLSIGFYRVGFARSHKFRLIPSLHCEPGAAFGSWLGIRFWIGA